MNQLNDSSESPMNTDRRSEQGERVHVLERRDTGENKV